MAVKDLVTAPVKLDKQIKSVAIIGGGASGAIALEALLKEGDFDRIVVYERRSKLGGIWATDDDYGETVVTPGLTERELDPPLEIPSKLNTKNVITQKRNGQQRYETAPAIYESLRTNIPESVMTYSDDKKFPYLDKPDQDALTSLDSVNQYINEYFQKNLGDTRVELSLNSTIEKVSKTEIGYDLVVRKELDSEIDEWSIVQFDAVIVATGHYHVPFIPYVRGIHDIYAKFPGRIIHAKGFNKTAPYANKRVIVIGGRASAVDTVRELKKVGADIIWSIKEQDDAAASASAPATPAGTIKSETVRKPIITDYEITTEGDLVVKFADGSHVVNPDKIIYATGYQYSYPFLQSLDPNITDRTIIPNVFQHTFHIHHPLISFIGTPINGMSFRVFEFQAIWIARFLAGKATLPSVSEQLQWRDERLLQRGYRSAEYHSTGLDPALKYFDEVAALAGGYDAIDGGKAFPFFTEKDVEIYETNRTRLHSKWALL